jgi:hypothetical protein
MPSVLVLDESAGPAIAAALTRRAWDVVVIGGGIRKPEPLLEFFEQVVNLVRQHARRAPRSRSMPAAATASKPPSDG